jgi:hypothetical protein
MKMTGASQTRPTNRSAAPRLEGLENRCLLAARPTVTFVETPDGSSGTSSLLVTDTIKNDSISINDKGTGTAGNVFVSSGGGQEYMSTGGVTQIAVLTGKGNDRVTYELDSNLQPNVNQFVEVAVNPKKGSGSVAFTLNVVGKILDDASLTAFAVPTKTSKKTTMTANDSGEVDGRLTAGITTFGSKNKSHSPEVLSFDSSGTITSGGDIDAGIQGSTRNDIASISYSGTNDGEFDLFEQGNGGNDQLSGDVYMIPGSTGTVGSSTATSLVQTSGKKDKLRFAIYQGTDSTTTSNIYAELIDSSKKDVSAHTANVTAYTQGSDTVLS